MLASFTVNSVLDKVDLHPGNGVVDTGTPGEVTLRAAIMEANALSGHDTINLPAGTYTLTIPGAGEDAAATGDLDITENLTISGAGAAATIIDAAGLDRVLHVFARVTVNLSGVTITGGDAYGHGGEVGGGGVYNYRGTLAISNTVISGNLGGGGGIYNYAGTLTVTNSSLCGNSNAGIDTNQGTVTITDSTLSGNSSYHYGGGISQRGGSLTIINSTISGNSAGTGGGIYSWGYSTLTMTDSTVSDNSALDAWFQGWGGGIFLQSGTLCSITRCTLSGNSALVGGGVYNHGTPTTIRDSTLSGNSAASAGAIYHWPGCWLTITSSTVSGNFAYGYGGGIYNRGWLNTKNTIIAANTAAIWYDDVFSTYDSILKSEGSNLIGDTTGSSGWVPSDLLNVDPLLGPLQDNGGPTLTHALLAGSPAMDAGNNVGAPATDQRGLPRIVDGDGDAIATIDIGAFEFQELNQPPTADAGGGDTGYAGLEGSPVTFDASGSSDPDGDPLLYRWDFDSDDTWDTDWSSSPYGSCTWGDDWSGAATVEVTDGELTATDTANVTVSNVAPSVAPDNDPVTVDEGQTATNTGTYSDPGEDTVTLTASVGTIVDNGDGTWSWSFDSTDGPDESQVVTVRATDSDNAWTETIFQLTVNNVAPNVDDITAPLDPTAVYIAVNVSADFTDAGTGDTHTAEWDWGDGTPSEAGTVDEADGSGTVTGSHTYTDAGVYTVTVTVTDDDGDSDQSIFQYVVVYDPNAGFVTGGGWIVSPEGAYATDPTLTGKANFGFVAKYQKGTSVPAGQTEFQFKVADFNFHSSQYQWLVVSGPQAKFKGSGTINGAGDYGFMVTAVDAALTPSTDVDGFRIKIWDKATDEAVYDNQMGQSDDSQTATDIGGGSIVIHNGGSALHAAEIASGTTIGATLTQGMLAPVVGEALSYWAGRGIGSDSLAALGQIDVHVADLSGPVLGIASSSDLIWIDREAAGYGWRIDPTAAAGSAADGMDLLSAVTHELGHKLGLGHDGPYDVMAPILAPGVSQAVRADPVQNAFGATYVAVLLPGPRQATFIDLSSSPAYASSVKGLEAYRPRDRHSAGVGARDQFFDSLANVSDHGVLVESRARHASDDESEAETIGDLAELFAESPGEEAAADEMQQSLFDEDLIENLSLPM